MESKTNTPAKQTTSQTASQLETMINQARAAMEHAYAPYSHFPVGVCLRSDNGNFYSGCNVENVSYGLTLCAEASAIANMVSQGERCITEIVVMAQGDSVITPCGACRQRLSEFTHPQALVHCCGPEGLRFTTSMTELLPQSFGPKHLDHLKSNISSS